MKKANSWTALDSYQLSLLDATRQADAKELARLRRLVQSLTSACETALDALGCDRTRCERLEAQRIIHDAVKKAESK